MHIYIYIYILVVVEGIGGSSLQCVSVRSRGVHVEARRCTTQVQLFATTEAGFGASQKGV